jgi:flagellar biosynthetic protein FliO
VKLILQNLMILALFLAPAYGQRTSTPSGSEKAKAISSQATEVAAEQVQEPPARNVQESDVHFSVLRTLGGLGLVVCVMIAVYFTARKLAPRYFKNVGAERNLRVIETLAMGDRRSISLIEVANNRFLVGNTPHQINLLAALPEPLSLVSEPKTLPANANNTIRNESKVPFRNLFEVEKKRSSQYAGSPLPENIRTKMRQLREALER